MSESADAALLPLRDRSQADSESGIRSSTESPAETRWRTFKFRLPPVTGMGLAYHHGNIRVHFIIRVWSCRETHHSDSDLPWAAA